jgi:MscS family membrane protein
MRVLHRFSLASLAAHLLEFAWAMALISALASQAAAQAVDASAPTAIRTEGPRETFTSFLRLKTEMEDEIRSYMKEPSFAGVSRLALLSDEMNALLDLEGQAPASRREIGIRTFTYLMDVFGRLDPVDLDEIPDQDAAEASDDASFRIPGTPIYIARVTEGDRTGEYLFGASTVDAAPRFFRSVRARPLRSSLDIESFSALGPQLAGPLIPPGLVRSMPEPLKRLWLDTPIWKVAATFLVIAASVVGLGAAQRFLGEVEPRNRLARLAVRTILPLLLLAAAAAALPYLGFQINLSGRFADIVAALQALLGHVAYAWLFWIGVRMAFEWIILSPRISDTSLDANLLRLVGGVIGIVGVAVILAFGGQAIGLPVLSVLAGLGIGGLAVALALRPTLENLVGGVMLYIDRPVRVGDFCRFGDQTGVVENIGVRSTTLRALDRTLISVPNAQFADMQIVNFAHCDQMLIKDVLGLRYETTPDQLRFVLASMRRMLHAHHRIDGETVRVRFAGYGEYALKVEIRAYATTREWNDFFAIREDVYLRLYDIVAEAGSCFAFPAQTVYLARDPGLDEKRQEAAEAEVERWRGSGRLPFPRLAQEEIDRLEATLDYPPRGSSGSATGTPLAEANQEPLSGGETPSSGDEPRERSE